MQGVSIVTSVYKSEDYVFEFYEQHLACIKQLNVDYEFVFADDGSPDNSRGKVMELIKKDNKVKLIQLSRNFGQYPAMFAGMAHASMSLVYTADSDLEDPPENLSVFYNKMQHTDIDMLYGVARERKGGLVKAIFGRIFYKIMEWSADIHIPKNLSWQMLMKKEYVDALLLHKESETLTTGLLMLTGFNQEAVLIDKHYKGSSSYTFKKRLRLALNSITAFSSKPLVFIGLIGILITILTFFGIITAIVIKLFYIDYTTGWISIILSIWMVGGLILLSVGIIGIYLAKIFNQVKNRPLYIVRAVIQNKDKTS